MALVLRYQLDFINCYVVLVVMDECFTGTRAAEVMMTVDVAGDAAFADWS